MGLFVLFAGFIVVIIVMIIKLYNVGNYILTINELTLKNIIKLSVIPFIFFFLLTFFLNERIYAFEQTLLLLWSYLVIILGSGLLLKRECNRGVWSTKMKEMPSVVLISKASWWVLILVYIGVLGVILFNSIFLPFLFVGEFNLMLFIITLTLVIGSILLLVFGIRAIKMILKEQNITVGMRLMAVLPLFTMAIIFCCLIMPYFGFGDGIFLFDAIIVFLIADLV